MVVADSDFLRIFCINRDDLISLVTFRSERKY